MRISGSSITRLTKLEASLPEPAPSPTARRLKFARDLYGPGHPALARLEADPDSPAAILEFRIDRELHAAASFAIAAGRSPVGATATLRAFLDGEGPFEGRDEPGSFTLRRLELGPDATGPMRGPEESGLVPGGIVIPDVDTRWGGVAGPPRPIRIPTGEIGEPLLIYGQRHPESIEECYRLAATSGDGLYLCDEPEDDDAQALVAVDGMTLAEFLAPHLARRLAIRSKAGTIETRRFGETWRLAGTMEKG